MRNGKELKKGNPAYERYIRSAAWRRKANERLEMDGHKCQVCGKTATEVHHLTYDRFTCEDMNDLVSLCRDCHEKAEEIYDPTVTPWAMTETRAGGNNYMAAMRTDSRRVAGVVWEHLNKVRGNSFYDLIALRQPDDPEKKQYWNVLKKAVNALCRKRYYLNCEEDRAYIAMNLISANMTEICLRSIEHCVRNATQPELNKYAVCAYAIFGKRKDAADHFGISTGMLDKFRGDDGTSFGPSLREEVLFYCGCGASAGIRPIEGFECLSEEDYLMLNQFADYAASVSGEGAFKGEYIRPSL